MVHEQPQTSTRDVIPAVKGWWLERKQLRTHSMHTAAVPSVVQMLFEMCF